MKKILVTLLALAVTSIASAQLAVHTKTLNPFGDDNAAFTWAETSFNFGKIKLNVPVTHTFAFTNKGNAPLLISSVQASCGCTVAEYSREAIAPGQQGFVKATYNAARVGVFTKSVTINANTEDAVVQLLIKGEVLAE
jgi:hypothetical protein